MESSWQAIKGVIQRIGWHTLSEICAYTLEKPLIEAKWNRDGSRQKGLRRLRAFATALFPHRSRAQRRWLKPGSVRLISRTLRGACFTSDHGILEVSFFDSDIVQITYTQQCPKPQRPSYAIHQDMEAFPIPAVTCVQLAEAYVIKTRAITVAVSLADTRVVIGNAQGDVLKADLDMALSPEGAVRHRTVLASDEKIFGLGERATPFDRRGHTHVLWNTDAKGYKAGDDPLYLNMPVYISTHGYANHQPVSALTFYDNPAYALLDLGDTTHNIASHEFDEGELLYYVISGPTPHLIRRYTELTGRHPLAPIWMLGYHQSRWSYDSDTRIRQLVDDFHKHRVPCDAVYLDIDAIKDFKVFTWDKEKFPDVPGLAEDLKKQGIRMVAIIDPGVKRDHHYDVYLQGIADHYFCRTPDGKVLYAPVWGGKSAFPDFTSATVRKWWGDQVQRVRTQGIAGFWNDMNEPAVFTALGDMTLPGTVRHTANGRTLHHTAIHNVYGQLMNQATYESLCALYPETRPVVISRAGWAGVQRYATSWTGDNESTWESLRLTIPMVINLGLSGVGFTGADIGGFSGEPDGELFTRWLQMAVFMPFCRSHVAKGFPDQEPWSYGEPYLSINRRFIELRYELLPYLYTAMWQMSTSGTPMVRPLWWHSADNPDLYGVTDAFLCGDHLLVAPATEPGQTQRSVILPDGDWYDFWSRRSHQGNQVLTPYAPLEIIPLYVRAGAIVPLGENGPTAELRNQKFLRLHIYPQLHPGTSVTTLYEDAGEGFAYQNGEYCLSQLEMTRLDDHLTIHWHREGTYKPPYEHIELVVNGLRKAPRSILADGTPYPIVHVDPVQHSVLTAVHVFEQLQIHL